MTVWKFAEHAKSVTNTLQDNDQVIISLQPWPICPRFQAAISCLCLNKRWVQTQCRVASGVGVTKITSISHKSSTIRLTSGLNDLSGQTGKSYLSDIWTLRRKFEKWPHPSSDFSQGCSSEATRATLQGWRQLTRSITKNRSGCCRKALPIMKSSKKNRLTQRKAACPCGQRLHLRHPWSAKSTNSNLKRRVSAARHERATADNGTLVASREWTRSATSDRVKAPGTLAAGHCDTVQMTGTPQAESQKLHWGNGKTLVAVA